MLETLNRIRSLPQNEISDDVVNIAIITRPWFTNMQELCWVFCGEWGQTMLKRMRCDNKVSRFASEISERMLANIERGFTDELNALPPCGGSGRGDKPLGSEIQR
jgi:hypothetical protein